ncbi:hypothetical protein SDRG_00895 [Saprolegnia diclina VS20]|uniref:ABC transmembrane type-1 domain-containing protein n=1 Tax=Saprolegnia diclina (strain VS20) TaxID=1156394 RepID=T0SGL1_SAPDV|nr:hypothetical protein SDRG_00895 [Saprolegnia diclina VS20]EQC42052.1 hypothetical protein SDRG_00895 [Saprolegnia diclina VS20]|eukprot:XP_008604621.1 hypothetical protein SDRG_00895 [Saprolegnia diclina VS20]
MGSSEHRRLLGPSPLSDRCPADVSGPWSVIFFSWLTPLLNLGNARRLEFDDLFLLNPADRATTAASVFHAQWALERAHSSPPKLWRAFSRGYSRPVVVAGVLKVFHLAFQFIGPILIKHLVAYLGDPSGPLEIGLYYTLAVFVSGILQSLALRQYYYVCYEVGLRLRSAVVMAVYDKALVLASTASTGEVATLISVDATRLQEIVNSAHSLWYTPLQIAVTSVLMYNELGVAFLGGVGVLCVLIPMTSAMTSYMRTCQGPLMTVKDSRLKAILEVLTGIKVLKLQAWETSFFARILDHRESELAQLRRYVTAKAYGYTIFNAVPSVVTIAAFGLYVYLGHSLDLGTALTSIALFENVRYPLINFPAAITALIEAQVSFDRLEAFLHRAEYVPVTPGPLTSPGITLESAAFSYEEEATDDAVVLRNISLRLTQPSLVAVVGRVGAGKSSLIQAVLAPMAFFDTTPLGRIINRLSKDVYVLDEQIPLSINNVVGTVMTVFSTVAILLLAMPTFGLCLIPLSYFYLVTQRYYLGPSCELQRLDAISRSPVHALLDETLDGLVSIRAYQVQNAFIAEQARLLDLNQRAYFLSFSTTCWLGVRLEFIGTLFATVATLLAVLATPDDVPAFAGTAGVALSYCFSIPQTLNWLVRTYTMLQTQMVSVERLDAYDKIEQ